MCSEAFDFPVPLKTPDPARPSLRALELFHGPTGAFKDFGARFVMACMDRLGGRPTILVATSGDTGGAVGCAAEGRTGIRAVILYPRGRVSAFQQLQLGCWRAPALAVEVDGDFDDCQRLVKAALADPVLSKEHELTSANSINIGRLLPQIAYLGHAALNIYEETGIAPGMIIPTGNLGHAFAAIYARAMGLPIGPIIAVTNANRTLRDWAEKGIYEPRPAVATIANAMDVGAPSNFERLAALHPAQAAIHVELVGDGAIRERIRAEYDASSYVWCPHSATAAEAYARLPAEQKAERVWIAAATADPYKFADLVEPLIGRSIAPAPPLAAILEREARTVRIPATVEALAGVLRAAER
jgi:threonine synthase